MKVYQRPMQPWPKLERHARQVYLPKGESSLYLYDAGPADARPLLLVHGLADEADTWRHLIPPLSVRYRVLAPDLPGFGRSDKPNRSYTLPFFQDTLIELLDELEIARATLAGHSLGGAIAQSIALAHPERVERLILVSGSLVARFQRPALTTVLYLVPGLGEWFYNRLRGDAEAAYRTLQPYYGHLDRLPETDREFLFQRVNERVWSDGQRRAFFSTYRHLARSLPALQRELPTRLGALTVPTVVIWGELDRMNPVENGRLLAELQPAARLVVVPDAGHNVHQEDPDAVLIEIRRAT
jgi:pimeloyl-ACP methyl ester carboxylesterase